MLLVLSKLSTVAILDQTVSHDMGKTFPDEQKRPETLTFNGRESVEDFNRIIQQLLPKQPMQAAERELVANVENNEKFQRLKIFLIWLNQHEIFEKFTYYGCYCFPKESF